MLWTALIIVVIIFIPQIVANLTGLSSTLSGKAPTTLTQPGLVAVQKPIQFTCFDALSGSNCGAVTFKVYFGTSVNPAETLTASASGVATTGNSYKSGTALTIGISGNSKVTEFLPFTVPGMDPNSAISAANNVVAVYAVTLGAWTINAVGTGGTTFTSGSQYQLTQFTGNTVTITVSAGETTSNAGYKTSYDIANLLTQYFVFEINDGGGASSSTQYATVTGFPRINALGNTHYYQLICPDGLINGFGFSTVASGSYVSSGSQSFSTSDSQCLGSLSLQSVGTTNYGGGISFSFALAVGSLVTGNTETFQIKMFDYYDPGYFAINGNGGPNAAAQGSTFTIKIVK